MGHATRRQALRLVLSVGLGSIAFVLFSPGAAAEATATPTLTTSATVDGLVGQPASDTATLSNGTAPTGTITFNVYGPADSTCTGPVAFTSTVPVSGNGNYTSGNFVPTIPSVYRWIASYSGDAQNDSVSGACNDDGETTHVRPANAVTIRSFTARSVRAGVLLRWRTGSEIGTLGFNVYLRQQGKLTRLNRVLIRSAGATAGQGYVWLHRTSRPQSALYRLQAVSLSGTSGWIAAVSLHR